MSELTTQAQTGAVVVAYFPDIQIADQLIKLSNIVDKLVVIDNTPELTPLIEKISVIAKITVIRLYANKGIAFALNAGVSYLIQEGVQQFFLFDQDSQPDAPLINGLVTQLKQLSQSEKIAQVGPAYFDSRMERVVPFVRIKGFKLERVPAQGQNPIPVDYLITSGACISAQAWAAIGAMDESLFIDYVDIEWGLRAKSLGWKSYGWAGQVMRHCLGDEPIKVLGKRRPLHSPTRHYYFFRNGIALLKRGYIPFNWKVVEAYKIPLRFAAYALYTAERKKHLKMMLKGLWHGVIGKSGAL